MNQKTIGEIVARKNYRTPQIFKNHKFKIFVAKATEGIVGRGLKKK